MATVTGGSSPEGMRLSKRGQGATASSPSASRSVPSASDDTAAARPPPTGSTSVRARPGASRTAVVRPRIASVARSDARLAAGALTPTDTHLPGARAAMPV
jgi:hypothetical protein